MVKLNRMLVIRGFKKVDGTSTREEWRKGGMRVQRIRKNSTTTVTFEGVPGMREEYSLPKDDRSLVGDIQRHL